MTVCVALLGSRSISTGTFCGSGHRVAKETTTSRRRERGEKNLDSCDDFRSCFFAAQRLLSSSSLTSRIDLKLTTFFRRDIFSLILRGSSTSNSIKFLIPGQANLAHCRQSLLGEGKRTP